MKVVLSIIIPVYNCQTSLKICLDSILSQTYTSFEVILIDDGSKDHSGVICDQYATRDFRIRVFHKSNGGVSTARNLGIDKCEGDWLTFVDSDDYLDPYYLENLMNNRTEVDLVISGIRKINNKLEEKVIAFPNQIVNINEREFFLEQYPMSDFGYPFAKLFSNQIIKQKKLKFDENIHMFEDVIFLFEYLKFCKKIKFSNESDYFYLIAEKGKSLSTKVNSFESEFNSFTKFNNLIRNDFELNNAELINRYPALGYRLTRLMNRCLSTLYINKYSKSYCLEGLQLFTEESWILYKVFNEPNNLLKSLTKYLLVQNNFVFADILLRTAYKLK